MYTERPLYDVQQTASEMYRLAYAFRDDMAPYATLSLQELFDLLKNLPWNADPTDTEFLQRPWFTLNQTGPGGDCDDKMICVGAWCNLLGIPFRFTAVSTTLKDPLHHVVTEMYIGGTWELFDPTYAYNVLGRPISIYPQRMILQRG